MRNFKRSGLIKVFSLILSASLAMAGAVTPNANAIAFAERAADETESLTSVAILSRSMDGSGKEPEFRCTGSIINATQILTAAHCVHGLKPGNMIITAPGSDIVNNYIDIEQVVDYIEHPNYSTAKGEYGVNDIAVIEMRKPFEKYSAVKFAREGLEARLLKSNLFVLGYGSDENGEINGSLMRSRQSDYTSKALKYSKYFDPKTQIAAALYSSAESRFTGPCPGDSGGPLISKTSKGFYQVGIVSYGAEDCTVQTPTFYMRVSYYLDWMIKASKDLKTRKSDASIVFARFDEKNDVESPNNNDITLGGVTLFDSKLLIQVVYNKEVKNPNELLVNIDINGDGESEYRVNGGVVSDRDGRVLCNTERRYGKNQEGELVSSVSLDYSCVGDPKMIDLYYLSPVEVCASFELKSCFVEGRDDKLTFLEILLN